jgi:hypothetical protein
MPSSQTTIAFGASQPPFSTARQGRLAQPFAVGRIKEYQPVARARILPQPPRVLPDHLRLPLHPHLRDVRPDQRQRLRTIIHEGRLHSPPAQALQPQAPVPANRSSTRAPATGLPWALIRRLKIDSRTRSEVGRRCAASVALADLGQLQPAPSPADDPHALSKAFRSGAVSITSGAGDLPISISRLPTI